MSVNIIPELYQHYLNEYENNLDCVTYLYCYGEYSEFHSEDPNPVYLPYIEEVFYKKIITDTNLAKVLGVEVTKKELTWQERAELLTEKQRGYIDENGLVQGFGYISPFTEKMINIWLDREYIPKEIIKLTYNNKTIEIYENTR
jgi:hypothetical protein